MLYFLFGLSVLLCGTACVCTGFYIPVYDKIGCINKQDIIARFGNPVDVVFYYSEDVSKEFNGNDLRRHVWKKMSGNSIDITEYYYAKEGRLYFFWLDRKNDSVITDAIVPQSCAY